ncbi:MAG: PLP-dependent aminotransferase family protein [Kineosporiaceae bacterium]
MGSLRERIAARCTVRGQATVPEQVLVTAGAAQGLRLAIAAVVTPGAPVLVEHPTWPPLLDAVRAAGGRPVALPVEDGWDVDAAASLVRRTGATAAALMVDGQNPTGRLLTGAPRVALAQVLARAGVSVVVNETLADLDLRAHLGLPCTESAPAFAGLTPPGSGEVISVGSASKTFWGGLRVGWVRASTPTVRRLTLARVAEDLGGSVLEQLTLVHLLDRAPEVIEERRAHLAAQCRGLQELLAQHLPSWSAPAPQAGLVLWCRLPAPISTAVASAARREGLIVTAGSRFAVGGGIETRLRLPFARPAEDLAGDVARLARAVADLGDFAAAPLEESEPAAVV